jgi:hypothetical protein
MHTIHTNRIGCWILFAVHIAVESGPQPPKPLLTQLSVEQLRVSYQPTELFAFSASSANALKDKALRYLDLADGAAESEVVDIAAAITSAEEAEERQRLTTRSQQQQQQQQQHSPPQVGSLFRVAFISGCNVEALCTKLYAVATMSRDGKLPEPGGVLTDVRQQLFVSHNASPLCVGFLYPGQGSVKSYTEFGSRLLRRFAEFRALLSQADQWLEECGCTPISSFFLSTPSSFH